MKSSSARQAIIETASDLFYQKGYSLTGINEIIKEAGVAKATLYSHFRSKDEICVAYLQHKNTAFLENLRVFINKKKQGKNRILAIFDFLLQFFKKDTFNGCWCLNTVSAIPRNNDFIRAEIQRQKQNFLNLIEEVVKENSSLSSSVKIKKCARQIYVLYEGAIAESHVHKAAWPISEARQICELLIE